MTDHKFEPFDRVLVRYTSSDTWMAAFISHVQEDGSVCCADGRKFLSKFVLPYDTNTKHLLNTSDHYEPPKPPHEYKWGQKVEALKRGEWNKGLYIGCVPISQLHRVYTDKHGDGLFSYAEIRPLPDTAAN